MPLAVDMGSKEEALGGWPGGRPLEDALTPIGLACPPIDDKEDVSVCWQLVRTIDPPEGYALAFRHRGDAAGRDQVADQGDNGHSARFVAGRRGTGASRGTGNPLGRSSAIAGPPRGRLGLVNGP